MAVVRPPFEERFPRPSVMGVVNVTPDSFSDAGRFEATEDAVAEGLRHAHEGAAIVDVGGESTRPGAEPLDEAEERHRVLPVIEALASQSRVPISVDTYKAAVADAALEAGAVMVNDISGLRYEPPLGEVVARRRATIVLMHTRGRSRDMYQQATYHDVVDEVVDELRESIAFATARGITRDRIIIDPGLGFAKHPAHSFEVIAGTDQVVALGYPVVVGASRKGFLTRPLGRDVPAAERDWLTAAAVTASVLSGAHIIRVHAVREMAQVARIADEIRKYHRPASE
jgi:dihydropteroate synthase